MKNAAKTVQATYEMPFLSHSPMEPMNFTADVRKDSALLIGSIQFQQMALGMAAAITGLKPEQITIKTTYLGGGFGRRIDLDYMAQAVETLQGHRQAGQAGVDARRRHDARLLPSGQPDPDVRGTGCERQADHAELQDDLAVGDRTRCSRRS